MPSFKGVDHVHVYVADRDAAEAWYRRVLGFSRVEHLEFWMVDGGPLTLGDASGSVHIALFERPRAPCRSTIALGTDAEGFVAWRKHLDVALESPPTIADHEVAWSLYFHDPDGNPYEITSYDYAVVARSISAR